MDEQYKQIRAEEIRLRDGIDAAVDLYAESLEGLEKTQWAVQGARKTYIVTGSHSHKVHWLGSQKIHDQQMETVYRLSRDLERTYAELGKFYCEYPPIGPATASA